MKKYLSKFSKLLRQGWEWAVLAWALILLVAFVVSVAIPGQYKAESRVLIVQKIGFYDRASQQETTSYVTHLMADIIKTESFYTEVITRDPSIQTLLPKDEYERRKEWARLIDTTIESNGGILKIAAYHQSPSIATLIAQDVTDTAIAKADLYHGAGDNITLKAIDAPIVSKYPARPNILLNMVIALVVGFFASFGLLMLLDDMIPDWHQRWTTKKPISEQIPELLTQSSPEPLPEPMPEPEIAQPKKKRWSWFATNPSKMTASVEEIAAEAALDNSDEFADTETKIPAGSPLTVDAPRIVKKETLMEEVMKSNPEAAEPSQKSKIQSWIDTGHF